jgi:hypothetical protein
MNIQKNSKIEWWSDRPKMRIGDCVLIIDGLGKDCIGHIYDIERLGDIRIYKVFSETKLYSLNDRPGVLVNHQGSYSSNLLYKFKFNKKKVEELSKNGLDSGREVYKITSNKDYPTNPTLYMSFR